MMKYIVAMVIWLGLCGSTRAQVIKGDDTQNKVWTADYKKVDIRATHDASMQPAMMRLSTRSTPQPLIVSLHSWSGDYAQADELASDITKRDWNMIHPHFRGPNNTPDACGSDAVVQDIDDAIRYMIRYKNVDPTDVHIVGSSGGGYAAMLCYMKITYPVKSFSSWVGISNLVDWYYESLGRKQKYARDILLCTGDTTALNIHEAQRRSPLFMPAALRRNAPMFIYAGIHDGYQGSVPITQSIQFYNKLVLDRSPNDTANLVPLSDAHELVVKRNFPKHTTGLMLGERAVHYKKTHDPFSLIIFEGKHEMLPAEALNLVPVKKK
jgi:pimeloyl-ACP methyl ester carboxylesterase